MSDEDSHADGDRDGVDQYLPAAAVAQANATLAQIVGDWMPPQASLLGMGAVAQANATLAQIVGDLTAKIGYPDVLGNLGPVASLANLANMRFLTLERGFTRESGTAADSFGDLDSVITADSEVAKQLRRAVATTQRPGSFGLDYKTLESNAGDMADRLGGEPDLEKQLRSALEPVQELTGLTDERLIDFGELLGWWQRIRRHKVSTAGVLIGFTAGLALYVVGNGSGLVAAPSAAAEALILGGSLYGHIHRAEKDRSDPLE